MMEAVACVALSVALYGSPGPATFSLVSSGVAVGLWRSPAYLTGVIGTAIRQLGLSAIALQRLNRAFASLLATTSFLLFLV